MHDGVHEPFVQSIVRRGKPMRIATVIMFLALSVSSSEPPPKQQPITPAERAEILAVVTKLAGQTNNIHLRRLSPDTVKAQVRMRPPVSQSYVLQYTNKVWKVIWGNPWVRE